VHLYDFFLLIVDDSNIQETLDLMYRRHHGQRRNCCIMDDFVFGEAIATFDLVGFI